MYSAPMGSFSVSAATVTVNSDGNVLLIQRRDNQQWQIPGGVVELGEQPTDAARRETLEESGVHVQLERLTGVYTNTQRGIVAFVFLASPLSIVEPDPAETLRVEWVDAQEAARRLDASFLPRLHDALRAATPRAVSFVAHDGVQVVATHQA